MAMGALPPVPANWQRWPAQQPNAEYGGMAAHQGMVQYGSRDTTTAHLQRTTTMVPQYPLENSYGMAPPIQTAHYATQGPGPFECSPYQQPPFAMSYRQYQDQTPTHQVAPASDMTMRLQYQQSLCSSQTSPVSSSPQIKPEPHPRAVTPVLPNQRKQPQTIKPNLPVGEAEEVVFTTEVDILMKAIQMKEINELSTPAHQSSPVHVDQSEPEKSPTFDSQQQEDSAEKPARPFLCTLKGCMKTFAQKTHLYVHQRAHTGYSPHMCPFPGCGKTFTQKGNLTTHIYRHRGIKPFKCPWPGCNKAFPQKGNLTPHMQTHTGLKRFKCIPGVCDKQFSSLGNLKYHINHFHIQEVSEYTRLFSDPGLLLADVPEEDRELFKYFRNIFKNSNKGIKGRGKNVKVADFSRHPAQYPPVRQTPPVQQPLPFTHGLPAYNPYSVPRGPAESGYHGGYDMYDTDQASVSSGTMTPTSPRAMYDEEQNRGMAFQGRLY